MGTPALDPHEPAPDSTHLNGTWGHITRMVTTALVFVGLAGAGYWGHATGWTFTHSEPELRRNAETPGVSPRPVVRITAVTAVAGQESPLSGRSVRLEFASANAVDAAGIDITPVWANGLTEQVTAAAEVSFDPARVARVTARAKGVIWRVLKTTGDTVHAGEVLALIDAGEVGQAKSEFQQALVQVRLRERRRDDLVGSGPATSPATIREAESAVKEAEVRTRAAIQSLANLGFAVKWDNYRKFTPAEAVKRIRHLGVEDAGSMTDPANASANLLPVRAPLAGTILSAEGVLGEMANTGTHLFLIVDASQVWVTLHVRPEEMTRVAVGQKAFFRPDSSTQDYPATVVWIGTTADEMTRTVPVRVVVNNATGSLRASTLGRGRVVLREVAKTLVVPHHAIQPFKGQSVVFVRDPGFHTSDGPKGFTVRVVQTGGRDDRNIEILLGLAAEEIVATKGSDLLLEELKRVTADH